MNDNIIRTIYRGYDITRDLKTWRVYNPVVPGALLHECTSEDGAQNFVDRHKRELASTTER